MLAIGIRYLCGVVRAAHPADRDRAEWPPHPDRIFMALAAAHFETDGGADERAVMEWLEALPPPQLRADGAAAPRSSVTTFVPVNDTSRPIKGSGKIERALMPAGSFSLGRDRQPRTFPAVIPEDPDVWLVWPDAHVPAALRSALVELCRKVTCIGHSASLVQVWVVDEAEAGRLTPGLVPVDGPARHRLRVFEPGRLSQLEEQYARGERPTPAMWSGYDEPLQETARREEAATVFSSDLLVFRRVAGSTLGLESVLQVTRALRNTVMSACPQPVPEWISGHRPDSARSERPHLAFLPLPDVGHAHADGHLLGTALGVPRNVTADEQRRDLRTLLFDNVGQARTIELKLGRLGVWQIQLEEREGRPVALRAETWTGGTGLRRDSSDASEERRWATVTPIVLDRHPKTEGRREYWAEAEAVVREACNRVLWADPQATRATVEEVILTPVSMFEGVPPARCFPNLQRKTGGNLHHTHAIIVFDRPIRGPLMVGAGRYRGYGLCRPLRETGTPA